MENKLNEEFFSDLEDVVNDTSFMGKFFQFYDKLNEIVEANYKEEKFLQIKKTLEYVSAQQGGNIDPRIDRLSKLELLFEYSKLI